MTFFDRSFSVHDVPFPQEFGRMMERAKIRCDRISHSERILGYTDTCLVYRDMAEEFGVLTVWLFQEITRVSDPGSLRLSSGDAA